MINVRELLIFVKTMKSLNLYRRKLKIITNQMGYQIYNDLNIQKKLRNHKALICILVGN